MKKLLLFDICKLCILPILYKSILIQYFNVNSYIIIECNATIELSISSSNLNYIAIIEYLKVLTH